MKTISNF